MNTKSVYVWEALVNSAPSLCKALAWLAFLLIGGAQGKALDGSAYEDW